jgi:hypothetical protein
VDLLLVFSLCVSCFLAGANWQRRRSQALHDDSARMFKEARALAIIGRESAEHARDLYEQAAAARTEHLQ